MAAQDTDVLVIGAGHNGLVAANYLARAGLKVRVVDRRGVVGGAAVTQEFHPGYRNSVASYVVSLLSPKVIRELELERHGLTILDRPSGDFCPQPDGRYLQIARDPALAKRDIAKFSKADAEAWEAYESEVFAIGEALRGLVSETPPNLGGGWRDVLGALKLGNRLRGLTRSQQQTLAELMTMSVGDYLDRWFESDPIKGNYGYEGVIGNFVGPYHQGSAYVLLHHVFGEVNGKTGAWGHAKGGMGAITQAMARSAEEHGVEIELGNGVREVIVDGGRARGVVLDDGRRIHARALAGACNPKLLFLSLMDPGLLPDDFRRRMEGWRCRSGTFRMNVALKELPRFAALSGENDEAHLTGTINISPSLDYIEQAYIDARSRGWAREPVISMCIPSILDETLAPEGHHVASLFCQHFNPALPDGRSWDEVKEEVADLIVETVTRYAPNFRDAVVGRQALSPLDLERDFGLVGGDIFHGALHLDQIYSLRPAAGYADYRTPVAGLYLCGAGAHPGGGVTGLPGHNAAREMLRDFKRRRVPA
ncbi:MAG: NAD(P)/FAD-dependent oxidoreductase [Rhodovibrionaceae bacterium]|nr:NAD(P)/FAD-dependent oxidoreductase [Rhodovibrionaceae bacterium]